jgi:hypothetical protein
MWAILFRRFCHTCVFIWMLNVFRLDIAYVAMTIHVCCKYMFFKCFICFRRILQVFYLDVAYVSVAICICCKRLFKMFHIFQTYDASVLSGCCICCSCFIHMLQLLYTYVASVCCKCFTRFRRMLQKCFMLQH